jgi:hypothetical protein
MESLAQQYVKPYSSIRPKVVFFANHKLGLLLLSPRYDLKERLFNAIAWDAPSHSLAVTNIPLSKASPARIHTLHEIGCLSIRHARSNVLIIG